MSYKKGSNQTAKEEKSVKNEKKKTCNNNSSLNIRCQAKPVRNQWSTITSNLLTAVHLATATRGATFRLHLMQNNSL